MLIPIRILSLLVLLILIAQILPNTSSYQEILFVGGKFATKRFNSAPNREANNGGEHEGAVIRGNKQNRPQMVYAKKFTKEENNIAARKQEMVDSNVKGEQIMSRRPLTHQDSAGYVAFTADYKSPRHHPPRHN
ncbi:hypothetical protein RND71_008652 [Anisodus tanguticus]|uniref:Uncharacterized protein n=1 Tax=Anisodus tanguticus TaxID=243964 RepID=A0AAE1VK54_9SOLA|nr:hypothetical protein RND71_008652 [Anisodus tanguticus]